MCYSFDFGKARVELEWVCIPENMKYEWNQRSTKYGIKVAKKPRALHVRKACKMGGQWKERQHTTKCIVGTKHKRNKKITRYSAIMPPF